MTLRKIRGRVHLYYWLKKTFSVSFYFVLESLSFSFSKLTNYTSFLRWLPGFFFDLKHYPLSLSSSTTLLSHYFRLRPPPDNNRLWTSAPRTTFPSTHYPRPPPRRIRCKTQLPVDRKIMTSCNTLLKTKDSCTHFLGVHRVTDESLDHKQVRQSMKENLPLFECCRKDK